jgi:uncharacterized protein (TIGR03067 family)
MSAWTKCAGAAAIGLALAAVSNVSDAQTALSGAWVAVGATRAGNEDRALVGHLLRFEDGRFQITKDGKLIFGGRFEADPGATPPTVDFHQTETPTLAGVWRGIFALDGDSLNICDNAYDLAKPRPRTFDDCAAPGYVTLRFMRAK